MSLKTTSDKPVISTKGSSNPNLLSLPETKPQFEAQSQSQCRLETCISLEYIHKELSFYQNTEIDWNDKSNHDILLDRFNIKLLINHYQHIKTHELSANSFEKIYKKTKRIIIKCDINKCIKYMRHIRNKEVNDDNKITSNKQVLFVIDLLDSIHTHFVHSYDIGFRTNYNVNDHDEFMLKEEKNTTDTSDTITLKKLQQFGRLLLNSKRYATNFPDEKTEMSQYSGLDITNTNTEESNTPSMPSELYVQPNIKRNGSNDSNQLSSPDPSSWKSHINGSSYDLGQSLKEDNSKEKTSGEDSEYTLSDIKESEREPDTINSKLTYVFGRAYYYWKYYKNHHLYSNFYINKAKFKSLKEEILKKLSKGKYDTAMYKAEQYLKHSDRIKGIKSTKCIEYGIESNRRLKEENLLSIILYTDYNNLSHQLKKTFLKSTDVEQCNNQKEKHRQFFNWSKLLKETVHCFGTQFGKDRTINILYHCVSYLIFNRFFVHFAGPTSCTPWIQVASVYSIENRENGILLELKHNQYSSQLKYFNSNIISAFGYEDEMILFGGNGAMELCNLCVMSKSNTSYRDFIQEMRMFDNAINGKYDSLESKGFKFQIIPRLIADKLETKKKEIKSKKMNEPQIINEENEIEPIMEASDFDEKNENDEYMKEIFESYCKSKKRIRINIITLQMFYPALIKYFISKQYNIVELRNIVKIFNECKSIITNYQRIEKFSDCMMLQLLTMLDVIENNKYTKLQQIELISVQCDDALKSSGYNGSKHLISNSEIIWSISIKDNKKYHSIEITKIEKKCSKKKGII